MRALLSQTLLVVRWLQAVKFAGGQMVIARLAPQDYHRYRHRN